MRSIEVFIILFLQTVFFGNLFFYFYAITLPFYPTSFHKQKKRRDRKPITARIMIKFCRSSGSTVLFQMDLIAGKAA